MRRMFSIAMLALLLCPTVFAQDVAAKRKAAEQSARSWLTLVDDGQYGQSWQQAGSFFQSKIAKADWEHALQQVRAPLEPPARERCWGRCIKPNFPMCRRGSTSSFSTRLRWLAGARSSKQLLPCSTRMANGACRDISSSPRSKGSRHSNRTRRSYVAIG